MGIGVGQLILILVVVLLVFGAGKVPNLMKDLARGIRAFKEGLSEEEAPQESKNENAQEPKALPAPKKRAGDKS